MNTSDIFHIAVDIGVLLVATYIIWDVVRALIKFGIAIAANRPMIATTIMISTRVNPALRLILMFI